MRYHGDPVATMFSAQWVDPIINYIAPRKVVTWSNKESLQWPGYMSCMSDPVDMHVSYDAGFEALCDLAQYGVQDPRVNEVDDNHFEVTGRSPGEVAGIGMMRGYGSMVQHKVTHNREKGSVTIEIYIGEPPVLASTNHLGFLLDPLH